MTTLRNAVPTITPSRASNEGGRADQSAQDLARRKREVGQPEDRERPLSAEHAPFAIRRTLRLAVHVDAVGREVHQPDLRNPGLGIGRDLTVPVVCDGRIGDLHDEQDVGGAGMGTRVAILPRPDECRVGSGSA